MMFKKFFKQRGQAAVFYAFLIPTLFLCVGVGIDLGWYYLNVSRLQNAADAAVLAGAWKLVEDDKTMRDYFVDGLTTEPSSVRDENYYSSFNVDTGEVDEQGNVIIDRINLAKKNGLEISELQQGKREARSYATENLYDVAGEHATIKDEKKVANEWTKNKNVTFSATLFTRNLDADRERFSDIVSIGFRYYKVELTEKIAHLFMPGWFDPMDAKVVAWAVIKPRDLDLVTILNDKDKSETIQNIIYQDNNKNNPEASYKGKWAHFQESDQDGVHYTAGDVNRREVVNIHNDLRSSTNNSDRTQNVYTGGGGNNNGTDLDSINLDFRVEYTFSKKFNGTNWDLRSALPEGVTKSAGGAAKGWTSTDKAADMRLITSFNFNYAWTDRNEDDLQTDVLWTHIESDPLWFEYGSSWNSVHQIVLNAHVKNTGTDEKNGVTYYTQRPFIIFYTGPEIYGVSSTVRQSQPVILNLYNDWNAILYMPNSPIIINGNGYKLTGFVVAKEFRRLKTAADMLAEGYTQVTDMYNKKLFTKQKLFTEDEVAQLVTDNTRKTTDDKGNIQIKEKINAPNHLILSITRAKFSEYGYSDLATFKQYGLSTYIAATYKEQFKKFRGITDDNLLTTVKFPTGAWKYVNTEEAYTVAKSDLLSAPGNESGVTYIKVIDTADNAEKYLDKDKLPYIKIRRNELRPYISVYDLGNKKNNGDGSYAGVTIQDDSLTASGNNNSSDVGTDVNNVKDHRSVQTNPFFSGTQQYKNYLEGNTISVYTDDEGGYKYFVFKSDEEDPKVLYEFRRVKDSTGNVFYIEEKEWSADNAAYYMEVLPDGAEGKNAAGNDITNPIIVDNWGDLQTEQITPLGILNIETVAQNAAAEKNPEFSDYYNAYTRPAHDDDHPYEKGMIDYPVDDSTGKYRGSTEARTKEDYLIPALERVYYPSVKKDNKEVGFGLSEDSCYSYFGVEEFRRVNYYYLNVNELDKDENGKFDRHVKDMFFTTKRASWVD